MLSKPQTQKSPFAAFKKAVALLDFCRPRSIFTLSSNLAGIEFGRSSFKGHINWVSCRGKSLFWFHRFGFKIGYLQGEGSAEESKAPDTAAAEQVPSPITEADKVDEAMPATLKKSQEGLKKEEEVGFCFKYFFLWLIANSF